jgi:hypothetical protein
MFRALLDHLIDDGLELPGELIERVALLRMVGVPIVDALDTDEDVTEDQLGMIRRYPRAAHERLTGNEDESIQWDTTISPQRAMRDKPGFAALAPINRLATRLITH